MLEEIFLTRRRTGVNLFFKAGTEPREIIDALRWSLHEFYATGFLDELVENSQPSKRSEGRAFAEYWLETQVPKPKKGINDAKEGAYELFGTNPTGEDRNPVQFESPIPLGYIDLYSNGRLRYNLDFCIRDPQTKGWLFEQDEGISRKHAQKYLEFVHQAGVPSDKKKQVLYFVEIAGNDLDCLEQDYITDQRVNLLRTLQRKVDKNIKFPLILIGAYSIRHQENDSSAVFCPRSLKLEIQADWLLECVQQPDPYCITNQLTGVTDNSVRTVAYIPKRDEEILSLLRTKLLDTGRNIINKSADFHRNI